jgi:hypothetical protein
VGEGNGRRRSLAAAIFIVSVGLVLFRYQRLHPPENLAVLAACCAWIAIFTLACLGSGVWVVRWLGWQSRAPREPLVVAAAGAGTLAALAFALGAVGLLFRPLLLAVVLISAGTGAVWLARNLPPWLPLWPSPGVARIAMTVALVLPALAVVTPAPFYDQLNYHLAMPYRWLRSAALVTFPRHDYSFLPASMGLLYSYALAALPVWAAQALHWWMGLLAVGGAARISALLADGTGSGWAAAIFAATPAVMMTAALAASDLGAAAFTAVAWLLALGAMGHEITTKRWRTWLLVGAFSGLAVGCKATAAVTVAAPLGLVLVLRVDRNREGWRVRSARLAAFALGAMVTFAPWLVRTWVAWGNPLHPFLGESRVAGVGTVTGIAAAQNVTSWLAGRLSGLSLGTFAPRGEAGDIGPLYLALVPLSGFLLLGRGTRERRLLAGIALGVVAWSVLPHLGRYLLPVLVLLAAAGGAALALLLAQWRGVARGALVTVVTVTLAWSMFAATSVQGFARIGCTLGAYDLEEWMRSSVDYWTAARFINEEVPEDGTVLLVAESRSLYIDRDVLLEDPLRKPLLAELAEREASAQAMAARLASQGVTHVLLNWKEARRIAAMNRRADYFGVLSDAGRARLDRFLGEHLERVFQDGPVEVARLVVDPSSGR